MLTDIEICQNTEVEPIINISQKLGLLDSEIIPYGYDKAKIAFNKVQQRLSSHEDGKLILVTAINPTPAGEGKTTISIGLTQALHSQNEKVIACLREPSLGPVFGIKGGAAGGGYAQVLPMEDINLHFTGDIHAITTANNLISALIDNHILKGNELQIDPSNVAWKRCLDMNDRSLRNCIIGLGGPINGVERSEHFQISVASEIMAILCLASDLKDLKARLAKIIIGYTYTGTALTLKDLKAEGAVTMVLKDAIKPNLVQTLNHAPVLLHGGPFANIAHGCSSAIATKLALKLANYVVTEAGFGADLGAEKFLDIKCRMNNLSPDAVVIVATVKALKYNGSVAKEDLSIENLKALEQGLANLGRHITNIQGYNLPVIVAINQFSSDTNSEIELIKSYCRQFKVEAVTTEVYAKGADGGLDLANAIKKILNTDTKSKLKYPYDLKDSYQTKIHKLATRIYGAKAVTLSPEVLSKLEYFTANGYDGLPICVAKTQYSFSDDPKLLGCPVDFELRINDCSISAGAGFILLLAGKVMTMPGLPKCPAALSIDIDVETEAISGLF